MAEDNEAKAGFWLASTTVETGAQGLQLAAEEGVLTAEDYRQSVTGCSICGDPVSCKAAVAGDAAVACRNAQLIRELTVPQEGGTGH